MKWVYDGACNWWEVQDGKENWEWVFWGAIHRFALDCFYLFITFSLFAVILISAFCSCDFVSQNFVFSGGFFI